METNDLTVTELSLKDLLIKIRSAYQFLLSKYYILLLACFTGGVLGLAYAYLKKPEYIAECSFVLEEGDKGGGLGAYAGIASMVGLDLGRGGGLFQGDNIIQLYESRTMIVKTLLSEANFNGKKQKLIQKFIEFNDLKKHWINDKELASLHFDTSPRNFTIKHDSILTSISNMLKRKNLIISKPDKKLSIIKVTFTSEDQNFAKAFAENLVNNVNGFYIETKTKKALQNLTILQHQTDSVRRTLNNAITGVALASDANPNLNPARQVLRVPTQRRSIDVQANTAILQELVKNLEVSKVSVRRETPLIQVIDEPVLPLECKKVSKVVSAILGALLFTILTISYLVTKKLLKNTLR